MAVDATVPLLVSLFAVLIAVGLTALVSSSLAHRPRRPRRTRRPAGAALRCPRIVLIDDVRYGV